MNAATCRLLLATILSLFLVGCSPAPSPTPTSTVTIQQAAESYSAFSTTWTGTYTDRLNADAAAADADPEKVAQYARTLVEAYGAFEDGIRSIEFPDSLQPTVQQELDAVDVLVALARQLTQGPINLSVKSELQNALGRVGQRSAAVELALGLHH